jgi:hypothetical protein
VAVSVRGIDQGQRPGVTGDLTEVFTATWILVEPERPGVFTTTVPEAGDWVSAMETAIRARVGEVETIYGLR